MGDYGRGDVAKEFEGEVDAVRLDPSDVGEAAGFEGFGEVREGVLCIVGQVDGDEGADFVGHWDLRVSRSFLSC